MNLRPFIDIVKEVAPAIITAYHPEATQVTKLIVKGIDVAEDVKGPSKNKKKLATDVAVMGALGANMVAKKEVVSPDFVSDVATNTIDTIIAVANEKKRLELINAHTSKQ